MVKVTKKRKTRVTNNDLPVGAHDDNRFRRAYVPSNIWWMAFQLDPFKAEVNPQVSFMRTSWEVIYGNTVPHKVQVNDPVFRLVGYQFNYPDSTILLTFSRLRLSKDCRMAGVAELDLLQFLSLMHSLDPKKSPVCSPLTTVANYLQRRCSKITNSYIPTRNLPIQRQVLPCKYSR